jgi:hypothetical protein
MDTTLLIMCIGLILYVGASIRQWRRLNRIEEKKSSSPQSSREVR